jgi:hypothetical protein
MFDLHVPLWIWIVSQIIGFIGLALIVAAFQQRCKIKSLKLLTANNFALIAGNALLLNWIQVARPFVTIFANATFIQIQRKGGEASNRFKIWSFVIFGVLYVLSFVLIWALVSFHWFDLFLLGGLLLFNFGKIAKNVHAIHITGAIFQVAMMINALMFSNIIGAISGLIILSSIAVFYFKRWVKRKGEQREEMQTSEDPEAHELQE